MYGKIFERIEESRGNIGTGDCLRVGFYSTWLSWIVAMGEGVGGLWDLSCTGREIFCRRSIRGEMAYLQGNCSSEGALQLESLRPILPQEVQ